MTEKDVCCCAKNNVQLCASIHHILTRDLLLFLAVAPILPMHKEPAGDSHMLMQNFVYYGLSQSVVMQCCTKGRQLHSHLTCS